MGRRVKERRGGACGDAAFGGSDESDDEALHDAREDLNEAREEFTADCAMENEVVKVGKVKARHKEERGKRWTERCKEERRQ